MLHIATESLITEMEKMRAHQKLDNVLKGKSEKEIKTALEELQRLINVALSKQDESDNSNHASD